MNHLDVTAQSPAVNPATLLPPPCGWAWLQRILFTLFNCPKLIIVSAQLPERNSKSMYKPHHKSRRISNPAFLLYPLQSTSLGLGCRTAPVSLWASYHQRAGREAQSREEAAGETFWERIQLPSSWRKYHRNLSCSLRTWAKRENTGNSRKFFPGRNTRIGKACIQKSQLRKKAAAVS